MSALIDLGRLAAAELVVALWIRDTAGALLWYLLAEPGVRREHPTGRSTHTAPGWRVP